MKSGYLKRFAKHQDLDLIKSFGAVGFETNTLPTTYIVDALKDMPDQNADGLYEACTAYAQCQLASDETGNHYDIPEFYNSTPPGGDGPRDMRTSLKLLTQRGPKYVNGTLEQWKGKYYNINKQGIFDWFDAIRVGLYIVRQEKRAASAAVPWFREWTPGMVNSDGIMQEPPTYDWTSATGHDPVIAGWTDTGIVHGKPLGGTYLAVKSWQGTSVGDGGWLYMSRVIANRVFDMWYTEVFTVSQQNPSVFATIDLSAVEKVISYVVLLLSKLSPQSPAPVALPTAPPTPPAPQPVPVPAPPISPYAWFNKEAVRHSIRVICDEQQLTFDAKNILTACIYQESRFEPRVVSKPNFDGSRDWGLVQINDNPKNQWIGPNYVFKSTDEVLNNPEKCVRVMIGAMKNAQLHLWNSYSSGAYKQWLTLVQHPIVSS